MPAWWYYTVNKQKTKVQTHTYTDTLSLVKKIVIEGAILLID